MVVEPVWLAFLMLNNPFPIPPPPDDAAPTPASVRHDLLDSQDRRGPAIRSTFLQEFRGARSPGPLHLFVRERRLFALQLYLLLACVARQDPWNTTLAASTWALALDATKPSSDARVSRAWSWLVANELVKTDRKFRKVDVTRLLEDGSGGAYTRPKNSFFIFPLAFFREEWHSKLKLPGTAVLLIALHLSRKTPWFELRTESHSQWYGVSPDLLVKGLDELRSHGLLATHPRKVRDIRARYSTTTVNNYLLLEPFLEQSVEGSEL
jgi:hypothetical protein